ncbi:hypothetical protein lerEdw1_013538 [Lerista edwardsae]|nr:hypothetical protein lerEdw1_013540 [Lerista edwardsae]KAJ6644800.1 hypothetical protein lerEdw1_013538 [Lerista edwardsae]
MNDVVLLIPALGKHVHVWTCLERHVLNPVLSHLTATPTAPSVFPLPPYGEDLSTASEVTVGCLVSNYFPAPVTVQWNKGAISTGIRNFPPAVISGDLSTSTSTLTVPAARWKDGQFECDVAHPATSSEITKVIPVCEKNEPVPPEVRLLHSSCKGRSSDATIELHCLISHFYPNVVTVEWLVDGQAGLLVPNTEAPRKDSTGYTFSTSSSVNVTQADWLEGNSYICQVTHPGTQTKVKSLAKKCRDDSSCVPTEVRIYLLPPTPKDLFINRDPKLYCNVVNLETQEGLEVNWAREKKVSMVSEPLSVTEQPNGTYRALSVAPVSLEDWNDGETFTCTVKQEGIPAPISKSIFKKTVDLRAPSVYLYPPPHEEITIRTPTMTLTCLVKDFSPPDVSIQWLKNHNALSEDLHVNTPVLKDKTNGSHFCYSKLDIPAEEWNQGNSYTCMVVHEGLPMKFTQRSVEKSQGVTVSVTTIPNYEKDDELESLYTTTWIFSILFLLSVCYSASVTLFKVKWLFSTVIHLKKQPGPEYKNVIQQAA